MVVDSLSPEHVEILSVRLPRVTRERAVQWLLERLAAGATTPVCFPDMSTLNIASQDRAFQDLLNRRFHTLNDGAGLEWAARRLGRPLPENLNGTDLCPMLLSRVPPGTRVYLLGASAPVVEAAARHLASHHPHLQVAGWQHGFFPHQEEAQVIHRLAEAAPRIVLVAMGNPLQVRFIDRHMDDPRLQGITWLAVGGLLDYLSGTTRRAPSLVRKMRLEWAWITVTQPHKLRRYLLGVPTFIGRCLLAESTANLQGRRGAIPKMRAD